MEEVFVLLRFQGSEFQGSMTSSLYDTSRVPGLKPKPETLKPRNLTSADSGPSPPASSDLESASDPSGPPWALPSPHTESSRSIRSACSPHTSRSRGCECHSG